MAPLTVRHIIRLRVRLIWPEVVAIQVLVLLAAVSRGLDYLLPPDPSSEALSVIERTAPMPAWGALFVAGGMLGLLGLHFIRWPLAAVGHVLCLAGYAAFALGSLLDVVGSVPVEGWRTPVDWCFVFVVIHWGFADAAMDVWREGKARAA